MAEQAVTRLLGVQARRGFAGEREPNGVKVLKWSARLTDEGYTCVVKSTNIQRDFSPKI